MNPLLAFHERHAGTATALGTASGALSWIFAHTPEITAIAGMLGAVATAVIALLTLTLKVWAICAGLCRNWRARKIFRAIPIDADPLPWNFPVKWPALRLEDNGDERFTVLEPFDWLDIQSATLVRVPAGFVTDFASVPRLFWNIIPPYGAHSRAAVVHDYLYSVCGRLERNVLTRAECDRIFREIMRATGVRFTRRLVMWLGVRLGGWLAWSGHMLRLQASGK